MSIKKAMNKYIETIKSDAFTRFEKEFARRMTSALSRGYLQKLHETPLVKIVKNVVNSVDKLTDGNQNFKLSTKSVFIHGNKSQVEFDYYGRKEQTELGDLIFIISVVFNDKKYFEKFTINQFKKDKGRRSVSWRIDKEQLYLLSRFPAFRGVKGFVPKKNFDLPNYSGCLGSYGLLFKPGDFAFISATELDSFIGYRSSLKLNELYLIHETEKYPFSHFPYFYPRFYLPWNPLFRNHHYASNAHDFTHKYLRMGIGEPTYMEKRIDNSQTRNFLHELLSAIKFKAEKEANENILNFINEFTKYRYAGSSGKGELKRDKEFDQEGGGIGIIHVIINLGEVVQIG